MSGADGEGVTRHTGSFENRQMTFVALRGRIYRTNKQCGALSSDSIRKESLILMSPAIEGEGEKGNEQNMERKRFEGKENKWDKWDGAFPPGVPVRVVEGPCSGALRRMESKGG